MLYEVTLPEEFKDRLQKVLALTMPEKRYAALYDLYIDMRHEEKSFDEAFAMQWNFTREHMNAEEARFLSPFVGEKISWRGAKDFFDSCLNTLNGELRALEQKAIGGATGATAQRVCEAFLSRAKKIFYDSDKRRLTPLFQSVSGKTMEMAEFPSARLNDNGTVSVTNGVWIAKAVPMPKNLHAAPGNGE